MSGAWECEFASGGFFRRTVRVRAGARGLEVDGRLVWRAGSDGAGYLVPSTPGRVHVRIHRSDGQRLFEAEMTEESGHAFLAALHLGGDDRVAFRGPLFSDEALYASPLLLLVFALPTLALAILQPIALVAVFAAWRAAAWVLRQQRPTYVVGTDGIDVDGRFVSWAEVEDVSVTAAARGWHTLRLTSQEGALRRVRLACGEHLHALIEARLEAFRARHPVDFPRILAELEGADLAVWVRHVEERGAGYRSAGQEIDLSGVEAAVNDPRQSPAVRTAAAYTLRLRQPESLRARVRVACASTADARLRASLLRIAEGSAEDASDALAPFAARAS